MNEIGERIKLNRKRRSMTQRELADVIGMDVKSIGRYERGETRPTIEIAKKISKELGVELLYKTDLSEVSTQDLIEELKKRKDFYVDLIYEVEGD